MATGQNPYTTLCIGPEAKAADISRAYRSLMRRYHPDTFPCRRSTPVDAAADQKKLQQIMDAYAILSDPIQRASYDHHQQRLSPEPAPRRAVREPGYTSPAGQLLVSVGPLQWETPTRRCS